MNPVRVDLMASAAGKIGGVAWHHLFLVAADAGGKQMYLRAGPQSPPVKVLFGRDSEFGDAVEDYEPPEGGPYGVITFSSGAYEPGGVDFDPVAANVLLAKEDVAGELWEKVGQAAQALQAEKIPYDPVGKGANWALVEALRRCGVQPELPPKRWTPGVSLAPAPQPPAAPTRRLGDAMVIA